MRLILTILALIATPLAAFAQDAVSPLDALVWLKRPVVIFADTPNDPRFKRQMELLAEHPEELEERDVVIMTDTNPAANGPLREALHPRDFMLVLIAKDGKVNLRKPTPWSVRELSRAIDKMPMRQDEINESLGK